MNLKKIYKEAKQASQNKNEAEEVRCLKELLKEKIGGNSDILLLFKIKSTANADYGCYSFWAASVGLILAIVAILASILNKTEGNELILGIVCFIYLFLILPYIYHVFSSVSIYHKIVVILEQIEKEI